MRRVITAIVATMLAGSALAAPATFDVTNGGSLTELVAPESDARAALVEIGGAADAAAAAKRTLVVRDSRHEYVFSEVTP